MTQPSSFYNEITCVSEKRIKELIGHAEAIDTRETIFPQASSYFRAHAVSVYLAWRDVTDGFHTVEDLERLAMLANLDVFAIGKPDFCLTYENTDGSCPIPTGSDRRRET